MLTNYDAFISYSHSDVIWVKSWLLPRLEVAGLTVCVDFRDFDIGTNSPTNMENAVERSRKTLLVLTARWVESEWTSFESLLTLAEDPSGVRRRTLPLLLEKCPLPKRLGILTYGDFTNRTEWDAQLTRVIAAIRETSIDESSPHLTFQPAASQVLKPNLVHPYPLQANFTGRKQERGELTAWLEDDAFPICELIAMGGMGKSALSWYWVKNDVLTSVDLRLDGVMWWSFYEGESSFAKFVDEALKYASGVAIDAERFPTTYDRAQELRAQLLSKRVLFVLDGFERQLRDYAGLDAAYKSEAAAAPAREARACVDPITSRLLRDIAASTTRAKVLMTTRLPASDLQDRADAPLAGVLEKKLEQLSREDALAFMRAQGVTKGTPAEITSVCEAYGYHSLSLRLLSVLIARDARLPGDIAAAPRHDVHADLVQRRHHVLQQSYDALPKRERSLLSRIAAFRSPMTYEALLIFNTLGTEAKFQSALDDLQSRGLLQRDTALNRYDLHPIVRHYSYGRLTDKTRVHTQLRNYFAILSVANKDKVQSLEDLAPIIELYHHTLGAGRHDEAVVLYRERIWKALYYGLGAYGTEIELIRGLVPDGEDQPARLQIRSAHAWVLNELANSYSLTGQLRAAVPLFEQHNAIQERRGNKRDLARALANAAFNFIGLGELSSAERNLRRALELSRDLKDEFDEGMCRQNLSCLMIDCGLFAEAELELQVAFRLFEKHHMTQAICVAWSYRAQRALIMGNVKAALDSAQKSLEFAEQTAGDPGFVSPIRDFIRAEWLLGLAFVMEGIDLNTAGEHLTNALMRCRRINMVDHEPDILLACGRWHRARGNKQEAQVRAEEALAVADRCEFRLKQAEIHNFLASLMLDEGHREKAREHAEIAKERAWCNGPPHCYKPALDEAEAMLKELGATG